MSTDDLEAARQGDGAAFGRLVEGHRRELHAHCYRMLGSLDDADDAMQETLLAAWRGLDGFAGRASLRTWLYRIATTRCLNLIRTTARRPRIAPSAPFNPPDPSSTFDISWLQPYPDGLLTPNDPADVVATRATVELVFIAALQSLPPRQTAALVLCDVLGFTTSEAAQIMDAQASAVKGLLQRARARVPAARGPVPAPEAIAHTAERFAEAFSRDDVDAVVAMLTDSAWLAMPPATQRYDGPRAVARFLTTSAQSRPGGPYRLLPVVAGGHPAFGCYLGGRARGLLVLVPSDDGARVAGLMRFLDDTLHRRFGLPDVAPLA